MQSRFVPITLGSPEHVTVAIDGFRVTDIHFPAGEVLPPHEHEWAGLAVMLDGSFDLRVGGRTYEVPASTAITEPAGERHANRMQRAGAHVLVVQVDPAQSDRLRPYTDVATTFHHLPHAAALLQARSMARELRAPDVVTPLALEGLVLEYLAALARSIQPCESKAPRWLARVEDLLRARFRESLHARDIATEVDVHPVHLMRVFRARYGTSLGGYVRRLRVEWAAEQLSATDEPLAAIAHAAGFADQSHFTRLFHAHSGRTPARYRRATRRRTEPPGDRRDQNPR